MILLADIDTPDGEQHLSTGYYHTDIYPYLSKLVDWEFELRASFDGYSPSVIGDVRLNNLEGKFDHWSDYTWGRSVVVLQGEPLDDKISFATLLTGRSMTGESVDDEFRIEVEGNQSIMDDNITVGEFSGGDADGKPQSRVFGSVNQVPLTQTDAAGKIFSIGNAVVSIGTVYIDDVPATATRTVGTGTVTFATGQTGSVTADMVGTGVFPGAIAVQLLSEAYAIAEIDTVAWAALDALCPWGMGLLINGRESYQSALDRLLAGLAVDYGESRTGIMTARRLAEPVGGGLQINGNHILDKPDVRKIEPIWKLEFKYGAYGSGKWKYSSQELASIKTAHPKSKSKTIETSIQSNADAVSARLYYWSLFSVPRQEVVIATDERTAEITIAESINLKFNRHGYDNGLDAVVWGILESQTNDNRVTAWR